jgi:hypothetical protein
MLPLCLRYVNAYYASQKYLTFCVYSASVAGLHDFSRFISQLEKINLILKIILIHLMSGKMPDLQN